MSHAQDVMYGDCSSRGALFAASGVGVCGWGSAASLSAARSPSARHRGVRTDVVADGRLKRTLLLAQYTTQYLNYCTETYQESCECVLAWCAVAGSCVVVADPRGTG